MPQPPLSLASEQDFLHCIDRHFPKSHAHLALGRGHDCALLRTQGHLLLSTDLFLEDSHFRRSYFSPADIGYKALAVNLSDIAGMGGRPLGFSLGLVAPPDISLEDWDALFAAMAALASAWDVVLTGGDLSKSDKLGLSVTIWGEPPAEVPLRGNCLPGDDIFICGSRPDLLEIGLARTGLLALEAQGTDARTQYPESVRTHLRPQPCMRQGPVLAAWPGLHAMMDLSDGLARDLPRLLGACLPVPPDPLPGAALHLDENTLHPELRAFAAANGQSALDLALLGGEDYVLLGCATAGFCEQHRSQLPGLHRIGEVTAGPGLSINGESVRTAGFDHFAGNP